MLERSPSPAARGPRCELPLTRLVFARALVHMHVRSFFRHDGVTVTCRRIIRELKRQGAEVRVLTCVPPGGKHPAADDVVTADEIIPIPSMDFVMPTFSNQEQDTAEFDGYVMGSRISRASCAMLDAFAPHVMHVTVPDGGGLAAAAWARRTGAGLLATWHSNFHDYVLHYPLSWLTRPVAIFWLRLYCAHMPLTLVPTASLKAELAALGFKRMGVWGRGVDATLFAAAGDERGGAPAVRLEDGGALLRRSGSGSSEEGGGPTTGEGVAPAGLRASLHIPNDAIVFCWTSRIVREKRFDIFEAVVARLQAEGLDVHVLIAGVPSDESGAQILSRVRQRLANVTYFGWVEQSQLARVYACSNLLLFPSEVETFGNVTLEGMASGLPCVVDARCSGHLVTHGVNGFTVERGDAATQTYYELSRKLCDGAEGAALRRKLGRAGRAVAVARYDLRANSLEMVAHYQERAALATRLAPGGVPLSAKLLAALSELVLLGFFLGATAINKTLALAFFLLGLRR